MKPACFRTGRLLYKELRSRKVVNDVEFVLHAKINMARYTADDGILARLVRMKCEGLGFVTFVDSRPEVRARRTGKPPRLAIKVDAGQVEQIRGSADVEERGRVQRVRMSPDRRAGIEPWRRPSCLDEVCRILRTIGGSVMTAKRFISDPRIIVDYLRSLVDQAAG